MLIQHNDSRFRKLLANRQNRIGTVHDRHLQVHQRYVWMTTYSGDAQVVKAFEAGASGYLLKNMVRKELADTIRAVHAGKKRMPPEIAMGMAEHYADDALSEREIEVLRQVAAGSANKIVADRLNISEETVKAHMRSILSKLDARDRTHAVTIALKRGIIEL